MGIHISWRGTRAGSRCLVPCRPEGGQVFRLISRCNFSPFSTREGPQRVLVLSRDRDRLFSRGKAGPLFSRTEGRVDPTFPVKLALNSSPCIMATRHVPHGNDYDFSRDNSIITPDSLRSAENFRYSSGRRLGRFTPCVNNC